MGAALNRHESNQSLGTPWDLVRAVERRWEPLAWDLAASYHNSKAPRYLGKRINSLTVDWTKLLRGEIGWLNPEFGVVQPWIDQVCEHARRGAKLITLTRGSVDADWYWQMEPLGNVYTLKPRVIFLNQRDKETGRLLKNPKVYPGAIIVTVFNIEKKKLPLQRWMWK